MPLATGTRLGNYEILAPIGAGGMGEVYRGRDTKLDREVAIKVLPTAFAQHPERLARFEREAKVLASLNHPNIATIYAVEESPAGKALVMELVQGETLKGPVPMDTALKYAAQIANALDAAHEKGITHRDLKPANIMLTPEGVIKVLDFGLAAVMQPSQSESEAGSSMVTLTMSPTQSGMVLGTAPYMSPEQAAGKPVDRRTDIWAFGVVLWELLTGKRLFDGETISHTLAAVLKDEPDWEQIPSKVRRLLRCCLEKNVKQRLQAIGDWRLLVEDPPAPSASVPSPQRSWLAWCIVAFLLLALMPANIIHLREDPPERQRIRFQIAPPAGRLRDLKVSPDGRFLAVVAGDGNPVKLWLRPLDSLETRLLTSLPTLGNIAGNIVRSSLFWSADGEYVGFASSGKLYKIARAGGSPVAICDLPGTFRGAAWRSDGTILFASSAGLYRVSSSGGTPGKVSDSPVATPVWLTAEKFLFLAPNGIFSGSLTGAKPTLLLPDASGPVFVPRAKAGLPDQLLFLRGETLMAQAIDAEKAELRGEAVPVAERVGNLGDPREPAFSASATGVLVFGRGVAADRELVWLDRAGKKLQTVSRPFPQATNPAIRLSPDDSRAIVPVVGASITDLWIAELNRNTLSRFTFDGSSSGIWSPDGRKVMWAANDGNRYIRSADGSGKDELVFKNPCSTCYVNDWSSDGKRISFSETTDKTRVDVWLVEPNGDRKPYPYVQSRFSETWNAISPDGQWMAYESDQPGQYEILVESIPTGKGRRQISTEGGDWPAWRRDGTELFFRQGTKIMAAPIRLTKTSVESGKPQALFEVPDGTRFQVSRDGQRFLIAMPVEGAPAAAPLTVDTDWRAGVSK